MYYVNRRRIRIHEMKAAGVFQVQEILCRKPKTGVASQYIEISTSTVPEIVAGEQRGDERTIHKVMVVGDKFIHIKD